MICYICGEAITQENIQIVGKSIARCKTCSPLDLNKASEAHEIVAMMRDAMREEARSYLTVGACLFNLRKDKKYKLLGSHIRNMEDLFKEEGIKRAQGYNYIRVYEKFHEYLESRTETIPHRRLIDILHASSSIDEREIPRLIDAAHHLNYADFTDEVNKSKGRVSVLECDHPEQTHFARCNICGKWIR